MINAFNSKGEQVSQDVIAVWEKWFRETEKVVWRTKGKGTEVVTMFAELEPSFANTPPVIYETTVSGGMHDGTYFRDTDGDAALRTHRTMAALVGVPRLREFGL